MRVTGGGHMRELTERQREILSFIHSFAARHGLPPTVREIGSRFKVTPRAAFDHLRALERKGALQRRPSAGRTSRALTPTAPVGARQFRPVPILGRIAAGPPNLAAEDVEGDLPGAPSAPARPAEDGVARRARGGRRRRARHMERPSLLREIVRVGLARAAVLGWRAVALLLAG